MINELIKAFATGFCVGAAGSLTAIITWVIYEAIRNRKSEN